MNTSKSRPLAKVLWPVMLLTAALSLPVDTQATTSPKERHEHSDRADKGRGKKQDKKQEKKADRQVHQDRGRHEGADRAELQRAQARQRAELQRQQAARQAELQRKTELQRRYDSQRYTAPRDRRVGYINGNPGRYRYRDRNDGRYYESRYGRGDTIVVDGYLTNEGYSCQALRDDNGELYMLVGNTYSLRTGDHTRVTGRVVDGGYCDWEGTAFEITDVKALWSDRRHRSTYYHHQHDGESFGSRNSWTGRRPRAFENRIER